MGESNNGSPTRRFLNDPLNPTGYCQVLQEHNGSGLLQQSYTVGQEVLLQTGSTAAYTLAHDGHGSVRAAIDNNNTASRYDYTAYGEAIGFAAGLALTSLLYCGQRYDAALDQYYLRARCYDPHTGRFASLDPFEGVNTDPQSLHKNAYCKGNPVNGADHSGQGELIDQLVLLGIRAILFTANVVMRIYTPLGIFLSLLAFRFLQALPRIEFWTTVAAAGLEFLDFATDVSRAYP